jgi:hypothetical protein
MPNIKNVAYSTCNKIIFVDKWADAAEKEENTYANGINHTKSDKISARFFKLQRLKK